MEASMESTLDCVENSLKNLSVMVSGEWLRDSRLREKIFMELNQVINTTQLSIMVKYCMKSVLIVDNTSQDMGLTTFDVRTEKLKVQVNKLDKFITNLSEIQKEWFYLLHFVKFSARGEMDRDSVRLYNNCTEDLKKIEMMLQQRSENFLQAFSSSSENELSTDTLRGNLSAIMDDAHSSVQSMLDACPRLSLLSYNRLVSLLKAWMLGPQHSLELVSECFHELFEGVGTLTFNLHIQQRLYMCTGFRSHDRIETILFSEPILANLSIDAFIKKFVFELRAVQENSCDVLVLHRIRCMQALLADTPAYLVVDHITNIFQQRTSQLIAMFADMYPNESYLLVNAVSFAEDVWASLGQPTGCITIARDDLNLEQMSFAKVWRISLHSQPIARKRLVRYRIC